MAGNQVLSCKDLESSRSFLKQAVASADQAETKGAFKEKDFLPILQLGSGSVFIDLTEKGAC